MSSLPLSATTRDQTRTELERTGLECTGLEGTNLESTGPQSTKPDRTGSVRERRERRRLWSLPLLGSVLAAIIIVSLGQGAVPVAPLQIMAILTEPLGLQLPIAYETRDAVIIQSIRLPRVVAGVVVGASLAIAGAALQGLFRNPLADPGLVGVSSGAALAAVTAIVLGTTPWLAPLATALGIYLIPVAAFVGGMVATFIVYRFATVQGRTAVMTLLLAGIAIGAVAQAGTGLLTYLSDDLQLRTLTFWSMGSLGATTWSKTLAATSLMILPALLILGHGKALNALLLGESEARHLGYDLERVKRRLVIAVALCVGGAVSIAGMIGFIGLVTPHLVRLALGPDHRWLLPASALLGASLLLLADLFARTVTAPAELPIGIVTALVGGPFFLWLLSHYRRRGIA